MTARGLAVDDAAWDSPWRSRSVADKALLAGGLMACALVLPPWPGGVATGACAAALLLGPAGVAPRRLARILRAPLLFIAVGALSVLVSVGWDGGFRVEVSAATVQSSVALVVRSAAATVSLFLLAATSPLVDVLAALRRVRVPRACLDVAGLAYRLVFVLLDSARTIRAAQAARLGYVDRAAALRSASALAAAVLVRSWQRAERLEDGLAGRGYDASLATWDPPRRASARFVLGSLVLVAAVVGVALVWPYVAASAGPLVADAWTTLSTTTGR